MEMRCWCGTRGAHVTKVHPFMHSQQLLTSKPQVSGEVAGIRQRVRWHWWGSPEASEILTCGGDMSTYQRVPHGAWVEGDMVDTNQWHSAMWHKESNRFDLDSWIRRKIRNNEKWFLKLFSSKIKVQEILNLKEDITLNFNYRLYLNFCIKFKRQVQTMEP